MVPLKSVFAAERSSVAAGVWRGPACSQAAHRSLCMQISTSPNHFPLHFDHTAEKNMKNRGCKLLFVLPGRLSLIKEPEEDRLPSSFFSFLFSV